MKFYDQDLDNLENNLPPTFDDWFVVRNIRDNEALANLQKISHANKNWFTVLCASIWPSTAPTISMFPDEIYVIWWVGVPRMHFLPQATPGLSDPWPDAPIPYVLIRRVWRLTNTKKHSEDYKHASWMKSRMSK